MGFGALGGDLAVWGDKLRPTGRLRPHCHHQLVDAKDVDNAFEIVGQHMQRHLGGDPFQRFHLEVGCAHP